MYIPDRRNMELLIRMKSSHQGEYEETIAKVTMYRISPFHMKFKFIRKF